MKLLVDMNLSPGWIGMLADAGVQALHWSTVGKANAPDAEIMAWAAANDYVVLTHDLGFGAILAATHGVKPSVVQIRSEDVSPNVIGAKVILALRQVASDLEAGALLTIDLNRALAHFAIDKPRMSVRRRLAIHACPPTTSKHGAIA